LYKSCRILATDRAWLDFIFLAANDSVAFYGVPSQPLWCDYLLRRWTWWDWSL